MLEIKQTLSEMNNSFGGLINRLHKAEEIITTFEDKSTEIIQNKTQRKKNCKKENRTSNSCGIILNDLIICNWSPRKRRKRE